MPARVALTFRANLPPRFAFGSTLITRVLLTVASGASVFTVFRPGFFASFFGTLGLSWTWRVIGGGELTVHGWIALLIGTFGTVGLAWGLMALAFKSSREGWDDRVDNSLDPGRDETDDDLY